MQDQAKAVCGIWIGYGVAMMAVAFGTGSSEATMMVGILGVLCALIATAIVTDY